MSYLDGACVPRSIHTNKQCGQIFSVANWTFTALRFRPPPRLVFYDHQPSCSRSKINIKYVPYSMFRTCFCNIHGTPSQFGIQSIRHILFREYFAKRRWNMKEVSWFFSRAVVWWHMQQIAAENNNSFFDFGHCFQEWDYRTAIESCQTVVVFSLRESV